MHFNLLIISYVVQRPSLLEQFALSQAVQCPECLVSCSAFSLFCCSLLLAYSLYIFLFLISLCSIDYLSNKGNNLGQFCALSPVPAIEWIVGDIWNAHKEMNKEYSFIMKSYYTHDHSFAAIILGAKDSYSDVKIST